jgi:uncharacterized membrane protein
VENLFYFLVVVQIVVGAYLIWQGWQWLGYARRRSLSSRSARKTFSSGLSFNGSAKGEWVRLDLFKSVSS